MARAEEVQRVRHDLYFWQTYEPAIKTDLSCCARRLATGWVLIDPILLIEPAGQELFESAPPIAIVLTSGNHARGAEDIRRRFSIPIYADPRAESELGIAIDHSVADGEVLFDELTVISLPGAGPGEIALAGNDILHIGDALVHLPGYGFAMLPDKYCEDPAEMRRSLGKLLRFPIEVMTFAHGLPIVSHARQRLSQLFA